MKIYYFLSMITLALTPTLLVGCASTEANTSVPVITINSDGNDTSTKDNTQTELANAAVSVSGSLEQLAEIEKADHPASKLPTPPNPASIGMGALASVDWTGPIQPLVQKIASASHYKIRVIGKSPAIPIVVAIDAKNITLADILRDADFQAQDKANIVIYPTSKVIELRYKTS